MAWNAGEPHGDAIRGNSGPGRVFVGKLFGAFLRTGTGDALRRRGNVTLRGRNRFGTGSVCGGSDGVATRFSGLSVSGVGWRGDTLLRSREARRYRVTSFGRRAREPSNPGFSGKTAFAPSPVGSRRGQRQEGQEGREAIPATWEERTSEGRSPWTLPA